MNIIIIIIDKLSLKFIGILSRSHLLKVCRRTEAVIRELLIEFMGVFLEDG